MFFLQSSELVCHADVMSCLLFCNGSMQTPGRSVFFFSNPLARGIMGIRLMNDREIGEEKEEERIEGYFSSRTTEKRCGRRV